MIRVTRTAVVLTAAAVTGLGLSACGGGSMPGMDHGNNQPSIPASAGFNAADVQFAQMMIPHHAQAIEMADLAATRANDPELKALAAQIKAAQQPEIDTMNGWLKEWGQPSAQPGGHNMPSMGPSMPGMMSEEDMNKLKAASGADFDRQFTRMMIAHHNGAIQMARDATRNGSNPAVIQLAIAIEQAQTSEVAQLQKILDRL